MMNNYSDDALVCTLKQIINYCKEMHKLLDSDKNYFIKKKFDMLDASNQSKFSLIEKMMSLINQTNLHQPISSVKSFIEKLECHANQLDSTSKDQFLCLLNEFKEEAKWCRTLITVNNYVVHESLNHLKNVLDICYSQDSNHVALYNHKGNRIK